MCVAFALHYLHGSVALLCLDGIEDVELGRTVNVVVLIDLVMSRELIGGLSRQEWVGNSKAYDVGTVPQSTRLDTSSSEIAREWEALE